MFRNVYALHIRHKLVAKFVFPTPHNILQMLSYGCVEALTQR